MKLTKKEWKIWEEWQFFDKHGFFPWEKISWLQWIAWGIGFIALGLLIFGIIRELI